MQRIKPRDRRSVMPRGSQSFKVNSPDGWLDSNGPVWWYGSDHMRGWLNPIDGGLAAGMSAVTRATSLIVNRLASSPWEVGGDSPRWLADPTLTRPDNRYPGSGLPAALRVPRSVFWGQWIRSALLWGMGWMTYLPDGSGAPLPGTMQLLNPGRVIPGDPAWGEDKATRTISNGVGQRVTTDREGFIGGGPFKLLELRCPTTPLDAATGITPGVLTYHAQEMGLLSAIDSYSQGTFTGAGVPSGYLKSETRLDQEQSDGLKARWMAAHGAGQRTVAVLSGAVTYEPVAVSPVDAALVEMKKLSFTDVANAFGVPGYLIGAPVIGMTYSNVQMEAQALYEFTLRPWATMLEETLSALLPAGQNLDIRVEGEAVIANVGPAAVGDEEPLADVPEG